MAFRADEAARTGLEEVINYLIPRRGDGDEDQRAFSKKALIDLMTGLGPVVRSYPSWHPLVRNHDGRHPLTVPAPECGYKGLDHTRYFVNGFITCPYGDGQAVIDSVEALPRDGIACVSADRIPAKLYNRKATAILVQCHWEKPLAEDGTIPLSIAMPMLLEKEIPCWKFATVAETWESMRPYFLGGPHGSRSSLFVNQETGQAMKKVWEAIINTGMFGPIFREKPVAS